MSAFTIRKVTTTQTGGYFKPADHAEHAILITKVNQITTIDDKFKGPDTPAAYIDYVDLDTPTQEVHKNVQVTHGGIINRLEEGWDNVLGVVSKVPTKKGYMAWVLKAAPIEAEQKAIDWAKKTDPGDDSPARWGEVE